MKYYTVCGRSLRNGKWIVGKFKLSPFSYKHCVSAYDVRDVCSILAISKRLSTGRSLYVCIAEYRGQVVQSILSLTSSLVVKMLTVLISTISNS